MATVLNLFRLIPSDDQQTFTDKANFNFDQIVNMGGGPPGLQGIQGIQGVPGGQGLQGFTGNTGEPGSKWFVENTDPTSFGPTSPAPNEGDYWFDTSALVVYKYTSGSWSVIGTLTVAGLFKDNVNTPNTSIIFTNPTALRSLVLSPVNYGAGEPQVGQYKLKLIGSPGSPIQNFGVMESGAENPALKQSYIKVDTISVGNEYSWELVNLSGGINFSAFGTSLDLIKQAANVSAYEFNSNDFKIQLNPTERLMSFYGAATGLNLHIGGHSALGTTAARLVSINDSGSIGVGDAFNNAVPGDTGAYDFKYDQYDGQLSINAGSTNRWARWRGKMSNFNTDQLNLRHVRSFYDTSGTPWRSSEIRIEHKIDAGYQHFIAMGGGATSAGGFFTNGPRPAFRLGLGGVANDGYYFAADNGNTFTGVLPRIWMGDPAYIKDSTGTIFGGFLGGKLNIQSISNGAATSGTSAHTALHLNFGTGAADNAITGITAGNPKSGAVVTSDSGISFQAFSSAAGKQHMMGINLSPGDDLTAGMRNTFSTWSNGESYFWSRSNGNAFMKIQAGAVYAGTQADPVTLQMFPNNLFDITANDGVGAVKSILINSLTDYSSFGDGFVGIGDRFSEYIAAGPAVLTTGKWYKSPYAGFAVHNSIGYQDFVPFQAVSTVLTSGVAVEAKPQTKFHVYGAVTFGSRSNILNYSTDVGDISFTVGTNNKATALRSIILGGTNHTLSGIGSTIIGGTGVSMTDANKVLLATTTHVSTIAPTATTGSKLYSNGDTSISPEPISYYRLSGAPILNVSAAVSVPPFFMVGELGDYARVMTLEGRNIGSGVNGLQLENIPIGMEFHIRNSAGTSKLIGGVIGKYGPGDTGSVSMAINNGGSLYEAVRFASQGILFIPSTINIKQTIGVDVPKTPNAAGVSLQVQASAANNTGAAATGGNLLLDAGAGYLADDGVVALGTGGTTKVVQVGDSTNNVGLSINYFPNIGNKSLHVTGKSHFQGALSVSCGVVGTNYNMGPYDHIIMAGTAGITIQLPHSTLVEVGTLMTIRNISGGAINVTTFAGDTLQDIGSSVPYTTYSLGAYGSMNFFMSGAVWYRH